MQQRQQRHGGEGSSRQAQGAPATVTPVSVRLTGLDGRTVTVTYRPLGYLFTTATHKAMVARMEPPPPAAGDPSQHAPDYAKADVVLVQANLDKPNTMGANHEAVVAEAEELNNRQSEALPNAKYNGLARLVAADMHKDKFWYAVTGGGMSLASLQKEHSLGLRSAAALATRMLINISVEAGAVPADSQAGLLDRTMVYVGVRKGDNNEMEAFISKPVLVAPGRLVPSTADDYIPTVGSSFAKLAADVKVLQNRITDPAWDAWHAAAEKAGRAVTTAALIEACVAMETALVGEMEDAAAKEVLNSMNTLKVTGAAPAAATDAAAAPMDTTAGL